MNKSGDASASLHRKSERKIQDLQDRVHQLEREILERDQASYERLDAIAKSLESLQEHYHKALDEQAALASALEQSQARVRSLQKSLDLSEGQLADLRVVHADVLAHLERLRVDMDSELNRKMLLANECHELRHQLADLDAFRVANASLLLSIKDLDQVIDQAEVRCRVLAAKPLAELGELQKQLTESQLRISELLGSLESERAYYASSQDSHQQDLEALRVSLSAAQRDYGDLLAKYQALEFQVQEKDQLVQTLTSANQLLADDLRKIEVQLSSHNELRQQVQLLSSREQQLTREILDLHAQVIDPQRERVDQLEAANAELKSDLIQLDDLKNQNQRLASEIELLKSDFAINEQAMEQQLRLTEDQRQDAEARFLDASSELVQANAERESLMQSIRQSQIALKQQLLSIRAALDPQPEVP